MHPYLSGADVGACTGWLTSDAQKVAAPSIQPISFSCPSWMLLLRLAATRTRSAPVCRWPRGLPLSSHCAEGTRHRARRYPRQARTAKEAEQAYLEALHDFFFTEFNGRDLDKLMRAHASAMATSQPGARAGSHRNTSAALKRFTPSRSLVGQMVTDCGGRRTIPGNRLRHAHRVQQCHHGIARRG